MEGNKNIQFCRWTLQNMSTYFQITSVFATGEKWFDFSVFYWDFWPVVSGNLSILLYRRGKSYSKQSVVGSRGVGWHTKHWWRTLFALLYNGNSFYCAINSALCHANTFGTKHSDILCIGHCCCLVQFSQHSAV